VACLVLVLWRLQGLDGAPLAAGAEFGLTERVPLEAGPIEAGLTGDDAIEAVPIEPELAQAEAGPIEAVPIEPELAQAEAGPIEAGLTGDDPIESASSAAGLPESQLQEPELTEAIASETVASEDIGPELTEGEDIGSESTEGEALEVAPSGLDPEVTPTEGESSEAATLEAVSSETAPVSSETAQIEAIPTDSESTSSEFTEAEDISSEVAEATDSETEAEDIDSEAAEATDLESESSDLDAEAKPKETVPSNWDAEATPREAGATAALLQKTASEKVLFPGTGEGTESGLAIGSDLGRAIAAALASVFAAIDRTLRQWPQARAWGLSLAFGVAFGCTLYTKQTLLIFFVTPLLWLIGANLVQRRWERLAQLGAALAVAGAMLWPWFSTNWIFQIGAGVNSFVSAATAEGDPPFYTLEAWLYYWRDLPKAVSWPILGMGLAGWGLAWWQRRGQRRSRRGLNPNDRGRDQGRDRSGESGGDRGGGYGGDRGGEHSGDRSAPSPSASSAPHPHLWRWYGAYILGGYVLWSCISNKDGRYILPYLPLLSLFLAQGLGYWRRRWWRVPWLTVGLASLLLLLNLFPIAGSLGQGLTGLFTPGGQKWPDLNNWPQKAAIATIAEAQPYQVVNVGLIGGSATVNSHTLTFYGLQQDFRIYCRDMGDRQSLQDSDLNSLGWFLTQQDPTVDLLSLPDPNQGQETVQKLLQDPRFTQTKTWPLPDGSQLQLFRRDPLPVTVEPLAEPPAHLLKQVNLFSDQTQPVYLEQVNFAPLAPPGVPVPITYTWVGPWSALSQGLVLLDWQQKLPPIPEAESTGIQTWIHDHGIGLGTLPPLPIQANQVVLGPKVAPPEQWFRVTEHTAMLPPAAAIGGVYGLQAQYLNAKTGDLQPLAIPAVAITLDRDIPPSPSLALDWSSELRDLAPRLREGREALDDIFDRLGRVNLYDPIQNYLLQAEKTLEVRLDRDPTNLDYAYALALDRVLQRDPIGARSALETVAQLDAENPFAHAYGAFIHLVLFQPRKALKSLEPALALAPDNLELQALQAAAHLLSGNLWAAWREGSQVLDRMNH